MKRTIRLLFALLLPFVTMPSAAEAAEVTVLHFSDYHSHALPFYAEGSPDRGGIARVIGYLREERKRPGTLVFSGGDMINHDSPSWSDLYRCAEWPWFNGIVDAMAFGNHDADYGPEVFARCRRETAYPILGANVLKQDGTPLFLHEGKPWAIFETGGVRIGVLALVGSDFTRLVRPERMPAVGARFSDRIATARELVPRLRSEGKADVVVVIGHAQTEEDESLARSVPGIDLILGTHSHLEKDLHRVEGTATWMISPWQYLAYVSRVVLHFEGRRLASVSGGLVRIDRAMPEDRRIRRRVARMQRALERDPRYASRFETLGIALDELALDDQTTVDTGLGDFVMDVVRSATGAHLAMSTTSSFRHPIAPGRIRVEDLRASLPYPNRLLKFRLGGSEVRELLELSLARRGTDSFCQLSGVRLDGSPLRIRILRDPEDPSRGLEPLLEDRTYTVVVTDYMALVAEGYRELLASHERLDTGLEVRDEVMKFIGRKERISGGSDGRIAVP